VLKTRHARIVDVRGAGLMRGIEIDGDAAAVVGAALEQGLLINRTAGSVIRLLPPYIVTDQQIDHAISILDDVL